MPCGKCEKCQMCQKSTHRTDEEKKKLTKRLNIIEGQVRGVKQMIENDRYCDDVLTQLSAINKALESLENSILESHIATCVTYEIQSGNLDGVSNAEVSFEKGMANIEFNKEIVTLDEIKNAIVDSGFEVE